MTRLVGKLSKFGQRRRIAQRSDTPHAVEPARGGDFQMFDAKNSTMLSPTSSTASATESYSSQCCLSMVVLPPFNAQFFLGSRLQGTDWRFADQRLSPVPWLRYSVAAPNKEPRLLDLLPGAPPGDRSGGLGLRPLRGTNILANGRHLLRSAVAGAICPTLAR